MSKRLKIYLGIFMVIIGIMVYLEYTKPHPVNWTPTYSAEDKIPLGTYILHKEFLKLFPEKKITFVNDTPSSYLAENNYDSGNSIFFLIHQDKEISDVSVNWLLEFANAGNDVFIISPSLPQSLQDSLNLKTKSAHYILKENFSNAKVYLDNPSFKNISYKYEKITNYSYFEKLDTVTTVVLGEYSTPNEKRINFIKQKHGKGYFYINLLPEAFSNYFMLKDKNFTYAVNALNYFDKENVLWDENRKSIHSSPEGIMMYIFGNPPLHWAWIILITGTFFYCIFFGKRLQRKIPIIKPLKNTTVEFTKTIGNLYYNKQEHQDIINKKIKYFLYFVRERYFIDINRIDSDFSDKLHLKSGISKETTDKIVSLIQKNQKSGFSSEEELRTINTIIDLFYKKQKINGKRKLPISEPN